MAKSMTGYGRAVKQTKGTTITVEIRSVNHRYLDIQCTIPQSLLFLEEKLKEIVRSYFFRGHIEVIVRFNGAGDGFKRLDTDWVLLDQYMEQLKQVKERYQLTGEIPMSILPTIPELFTIHETETDTGEWMKMVKACVDSACTQVLETRRTEGEKMLADISERLYQIQSYISLLRTQRDKVIKETRERIHQRIKMYTNEVETDNARLYQEIALLAEKGDITEEVTRLSSHIDHFFATIKQTEQIGRRLDFILQEMHRETNTIGSKSTDPQISEWVVSMKSELEKMKEQIQNME